MTDTPKDALVRTVPQRTFSLMPQSLGEAKEIAHLIANSDFAPKDYKGKPDNVIVALQMGADLGLKPMQALQNIAVINGRPSIWGDAALALSMEVLESFSETFEGEYPNDDFTAICVAKRRGWPEETRRTFSIADAKAAKLWNKKGQSGGDTPWVTYPKRMLQLRARGFTLRDVASDRLLGLVLAEEAGDYASIEGHVIASEVVTDAPESVMDKVPDAIRENIEKAFETLNLAPGMRLAKLNEYLGAEGVVPEEGALQLLEWCKDEYAKRKTGQPRGKRKAAPEGNGKAPAEPVKTEAAKDPDPPQTEEPPHPATEDPAPPAQATAPVAPPTEALF